MTRNKVSRTDDTWTYRKRRDLREANRQGDMSPSVTMPRHPRCRELGHEQQLADGGDAEDGAAHEGVRGLELESDGHRGVDCLGLEKAQRL